MDPRGRRLAWLAGSALAFAATQALPLPGEQRIVLGITAAAMLLWVSESYPLVATALASSLLLVVVADRPVGVVFQSYFDPVIVLLLGGFFLGLALSKHGLDAALAARVLRWSGTRPSRALLAVMVTTATFSMWISNTAATAIMLPIALGTLAARDETAGPDAEDAEFANRGRCLVLGIAAAANIGGIGTPIGTTANPLAIGFLAEQGIRVGFLDWMVRTVPLVVIMVFLAWVILLRVYPPGTRPLTAPAVPSGFTRTQYAVMAVFFATALAWLTTDWHGHSAPVVALAAVVLLFLTRLVGEDDVGRAGWPTLLLIGGGLALGEAILDSGLAQDTAGWLASSLAGAPIVVVFAATAVVAVLLTTMASNTATAVLMLPVALHLSDDLGIAALPLVMLAAVTLSLDFLVPVGTPPNAMAYATGRASVRDMLRSGSLITVTGTAVATAVAITFW